MTTASTMGYTLILQAGVRRVIWDGHPSKELVSQRPTPTYYSAGSGRPKLPVSIHSCFSKLHQSSASPRNT